MICPRCQSEYREGFTRCADCDVELVMTAARSTNEASPDTPDENSPATAADDPYCVFWEGEDTRVFAEICGVLEEEGIAYRALRHDVQIFRFSPNSKMRIGVLFSKFHQAERVVVEAFGATTETRSLSWPNSEDLS
jgi:hypothetical protein